MFVFIVLSQILREEAFRFLGHLLENILFRFNSGLIFNFQFSIYFHDVSGQNLLERLPLIFVCRETKGGHNHITFVEPARRQIAQHGAHILVFELAAQLLQHNVALPDLTVLTLFALYAEGLALAYHT